MVETESEERPRGLGEHIGCQNKDTDVCKPIFPAVGGNVIKMTRTNDFLTTEHAHTYKNRRFYIVASTFMLSFVSRTLPFSTGLSHRFLSFLQFRQRLFLYQLKL